MRTAIFVFVTSTLSIDTSEDGLLLEQLRARPTPLVRANTLTLAPGVYLVMSREPITVQVELKNNVDIVTGNDKDDAPEPRPKLFELPGFPATPAVRAEIQGFFTTARGISDAVMNGATAP